MYPQVPHRALKTVCIQTHRIMCDHSQFWKRAQRPANLILHLQLKKEIPEGEGTHPSSP